MPGHEGTNELGGSSRGVVLCVCWPTNATPTCGLAAAGGITLKGVCSFQPLCSTIGISHGIHRMPRLHASHAQASPLQGRGRKRPPRATSLQVGLISARARPQAASNRVAAGIDHETFPRTPAKQKAV